jgi:hypothetical protein
LGVLLVVDTLETTGLGVIGFAGILVGVDGKVFLIVGVALLLPGFATVVFAGAFVGVDIDKFLLIVDVLPSPLASLFFFGILILLNNANSSTFLGVFTFRFFTNSCTFLGSFVPGTMSTRS